MCLFKKCSEKRKKGKEGISPPAYKDRGLHAAYEMNRQEAIEFLLDHYENPRNKGSIENPDVDLTGGNPGCADLITMQARFDKHGKLEAIVLEGQGCSISLALASS